MAATKNSPKGGHHPAGEDTFGTRKLHGPALITLAGVGTEVFIEFIGYIHKVVGIGRCRLLPRDVGPNRRVLAVEVEPLFGLWLLSGLIASTGHSGSQTPQSMHSSGWMTSMFSPS